MPAVAAVSLCRHWRACLWNYLAGERDVPTAFRVWLLTAGTAPGLLWGDLGSSQHV